MVARSHFYGSGGYINGGFSSRFNTLALQLNGVNQWITVPSDASLELTDAFSITAWIKVPTTVSNFAQAVSKGGGSANGWSLQLRELTDEWRFWINFGVNVVGDGSNGGWYYSTRPKTWGDNLYHFAAGTWGGVIPKIYVDAVLGTNPVAPSGEALPNIAMDSSIFIMGAESDLENPAAIIIDQVQYYNRELSAAEVTNIFNEGEPKNETGRAGAVSNWPIGEAPGDDPTGGTGKIGDVVGSNDGTPIGTTVFTTDVP